jgi:hypothetical protein
MLKALGLPTVVFAGVVLLLAATATGSPISAVGTAEQVTEGEFAGFYKYTYQVTWDLAKGLSHLDFILPDCEFSECHLGFSSDSGLPPDGMSTGANYSPGGPADLTVSYIGTYETRDPSISLNTPIIKWEPDGGVGKLGIGTFWFYTSTAPTTGVFEDLLVAKNGQNATYGDILGEYPSCEPQRLVPVAPEPATLAFLGAGVLAVMAGRRRRMARRK